MKRLISTGSVLMIVVVALLSISPAEIAVAVQEKTIIATVRDGRLTIRAADGAEISVNTALPVDSISLSPDGTRAAAVIGTPLTYGSGAAGQVIVLDLATGVSLFQTGFNEAVLTDVVFSPVGNLVAFIKDYREIWTLNLSTGDLKKLIDVVQLPGATGLLYHPAFSLDGLSIVVGLVEETFHGEDDKLDNLWLVPLSGTPVKLTNFSVPNIEQAWLTVRGPIPLAAGQTLFVVARFAEGRGWATVLDAAGRLRTVGPVPSFTSTIAVTNGRAYFTVFNLQSGKLDLYGMLVDERSPGWDKWCTLLTCSLLAAGIDDASIVAPPTQSLPVKPPIGI